MSVKFYAFVYAAAFALLCTITVVICLSWSMSMTAKRSSECISEINRLRKENAELREHTTEYIWSVAVTNIDGTRDTIELATYSVDSEIVIILVDEVGYLATIESDNYIAYIKPGVKSIDNATLIREL